MVGDFKSTWTYNMTNIINLVGEKCALLKLQSDDGLFQKVENKSSMVDVFVRCSRNGD